MAQHRFTESELEELERRWEGDTYPMTRVNAQRDKSSQPPKQMSDQRLADLSQIPAQIGATGDAFPGRPPWTRKLALGRDYLSKCVILVRAPHPPMVPAEVPYLFQYALQDKYNFTLLELQRSPGRDPK